MKTSGSNAVLLSYALADRPQAKVLLAKLRSMGIVGPNEQVIDHVKIIMDSKASRDDIKKAIAQVSKVIVFWTAGGAESAWINYETAMADALGKEILVIVPAGEKARLPDHIAENTVLELDKVD